LVNYGYSFHLVKPSSLSKFRSGYERPLPDFCPKAAPSCGVRLFVL